MNRIAILILALATGVGALYAVWQTLGSADASGLGTGARVVATALILGVSAVTFFCIAGPTHRAALLKRTALVALMLGIAGVAINAFIGGRTNAPDGPVFVISMLLVLQAFLSIGYASRAD